MSDDSWYVVDNNGNQVTEKVPYSIAVPISGMGSNTNIIIVKDPKTNKQGAVRLVDRKKSTDRLPGESYAEWVQRLHRMGVGVK